MTPFHTADSAEDQEIQLFTRNRSMDEGFSVPAPARVRSTEPALSLILQKMIVQFRSAWTWIDQKRTQQATMRRLRVAETISLGEKRFVSILQVDGAQYLIGGAAGNVSLLAVLERRQSLEEIVRRQPSVIGEQR